jgi:nitric oxide reductase subunit C
MAADSSQCQIEALMNSFFTKSMSRNIFYGGMVFSALLFLALTFHTIRKMPQRDHRENLTAEVVRGKHLWETRNCVGCHTILGEGAYFAPGTGQCLQAARCGLYQSLD